MTTEHIKARPEAFTYDADRLTELLSCLDDDTLIDDSTYQLTDKGRDALGINHTPGNWSDDEIFALMNKGCELQIGTVGVMQSDNLTIVELTTVFRFPVLRSSGIAFEEWKGQVSGEARRNPKDKGNASIGVLAAYSNALAQLQRDITKRLEGELKHAEDMRWDGKRRRAAKLMDRDEISFAAPANPVLKEKKWRRKK